MNFETHKLQERVWALSRLIRAAAHDKDCACREKEACGCGLLHAGAKPCDCGLVRALGHISEILGETQLDLKIREGQDEFLAPHVGTQPKTRLFR